MKLALDFGLSNLDVALVRHDHAPLAGLQTWWGANPGVDAALVGGILERFGVAPKDLELIATTGGRHRDLPARILGVPVVPVGEAEAVGRGGLALSGATRALVVSCGTGTAMIAASHDQCQHVTGSAVGGGTLLGLSRLLLGTHDPLEVAALAAQGDPSRVDSTLLDAIGGGIGHLPADATAVNFGRVAREGNHPSRPDVAAALVTLVSQVIAVIALNAAKANALPETVVVGRLPELEPVRVALLRVWGFYGVPAPAMPQQGGFATALGAALAAQPKL